ncbi:MAG: RnfABCDGE type electron transport complex subunit D [Spirochaetia bacterium]
MRFLRVLFDKMLQSKFFYPIKPVIKAADDFFYGTPLVTQKAPHILDNLDIKRYMSTVILALLPATAAAVYFFGLRAVEIIIVSYVAGGLVEVIFAVVRKKPVEEGFLVTGLIFPLVLPPTVPLWVVVVGIVFGVFFGKEVFGGTGRNIFNPALVGRLFITIAFPQIMSTAWLLPFSDAVTAATPLVMYKSTHTITPLLDLLFGNAAGSMGETFRLGIIAGGLFLMISKVSNFRIVVAYLGTVALLSSLGNMFLPASVAPPLFQLLAGGLLFGSMFMATDPVSSCYTKGGKYVFGIGCGFFTVLIRSFSGYVEGVMFSIVFMNAFAPIIDQIVVRIKFRPVARGTRGRL